MRQLHFDDFHGWDYLSTERVTANAVFLLYALPLSLVPPLMLYYAGTHYQIEYLSLLKGDLLQTVCGIFFLAEQAMLFLMAAAVQRIGETLLSPTGEFEPSYENSLKLSAIGATPMWLAPLVLFVPNLTIALLVAPLALIASAAMIFQGTPAIFGIEERTRAALYSTAIVFAGIVGWATMFYVVLFILNVAMP